MVNEIIFRILAFFRLPMLKREVERMIFPWMPSFLKSYIPPPRVDPSSFSVKHTFNGLQSSVTFNNNSRLDYSEQRSEGTTKNYKPILPKSDDQISDNGPPLLRHCSGARCNKTSLLRY